MEILLRKETIKQYDIKKCKENIEDIIREYIKIRYQYLNVQLLGEIITIHRLHQTMN